MRPARIQLSMFIWLRASAKAIARDFASSTYMGTCSTGSSNAQNRKAMSPSHSQSPCTTPPTPTREHLKIQFQVSPKSVPECVNCGADTSGSTAGSVSVAAVSPIDPVLHSDEKRLARCELTRRIPSVRGRGLNVRGEA